MTEKRRQLKQKRKQQVQMTRLILCAGILALSVLLGMLAGRLGKSIKEKNISGLAGTEVSPDSQVAAVSQDKNQAEKETAAVTRTWEDLPDIGALYGIHVYGKGWSRYFADDAYGMAPVDRYVTAIKVTLHNQPTDISGTISYQVNLSGSGWLDWVEDTQMAGDESTELPLEAMRIKLTGELAEYYDVLYSVLQESEWTDWVRNGEEAGVAGAGKRLDGILISVVKKQAGVVSYAGDIDPSRPMVALTYDDGPSRAVTPRILELLRENNARATFFMVGNRIAKHQDLVDQMADLRCEVANHTYDHKLMNKVDSAEMTRQLEITNQVIADACGVSPVLMRPCGGTRSDAGMLAVGATSMPAILWSIDTLDWKSRDAQSTIQNVLSNVKDGDIILMHDLYDATAEASETIIPELINRGYQLELSANWLLIGAECCRGGLTASSGQKHNEKTCVGGSHMI